MTSILCIEDEADLREDIVEELEDHGYKVFEAANGREGLEMIFKYTPDMVLSDITMPEMNGHEMLVELRKNHPKYAQMPLIFLSALSDRNEVISGVSLGADDYLVKPIDYAMMIAKVDATIRQMDRFKNRKNAEMVRLYKSLTSEKHPDASPAPADKSGVGETAEATPKPPTPIIQLPLENIAMVAIATIETDIQMFGGMLLRNYSPLKLFATEDEYFEAAGDLKSHIVHLWKFDLVRQCEFLERNSEINPSNVIVRLAPRSPQETAFEAQPSPIEKTISLPVTAREMRQILTGWIE
ncbi:MAG: response regulator transcription factor [Alphaproteobacteria bacterium]